MPPHTIPSTRFDTAPLPPGDQFDAWREIIAVVFDVEPLQSVSTGAFAATASAFHLGDLVLVNTRFDGQQFRRTPRQIRTDWLDHFLVQYYRHGGYVGEVGRDGLEIAPGSVSVLDLGQAVQTRATAAECVSLVVPRDMMSSLLPGADALHGQVLDGACSTLLGDHLTSLERQLPVLSAAQAPDVARATGHLVAACLRPGAVTAEQAQLQLDELLLVRARRFVDGWIDAPTREGDVTADDICRAIGTSRSRLYALFKPQGGVRRYVQGRRLARLHAALADPRQRASIMVLAERHGFSSHAHLSRLFRRRYGYSPSELRARPAVALEPSGTRDPRVPAGDGPGFDDWIRSLRG